MRDVSPDPARLFLVGLVGVSLLSGCHGTSRRLVNRPAPVGAEPALKADVTPGVTVVEPGDSASLTTAAPPTRMVGALDRHPLFRKPKQYFDSTNSNKAVKVAAAAVVGVPAGIVGELKQIVVGAPSAEATTAPASTVY